MEASVAMRLCRGFCLLVMWAVFGGAPSLMAEPPRNDERDGSVAEVVLHHRRTEPRPDTVSYRSWTPVTRLDNGRYKVTVVFVAENPYDRLVTRKQIILLDDSGGIHRVLECR
jgi:hypothetical protein